MHQAVDGDENTNFFYGHVNCKNRKSRINGLSINGRWTSNFDEIKLEANCFFNDKFSEPRNRPKLFSPHFRSLSTMDAIRLEAPIEVDEIKTVVWAFGSDSAPGPDVFTFKFLKTYRDTIEVILLTMLGTLKNTGPSPMVVTPLSSLWFLSARISSPLVTLDL